MYDYEKHLDRVEKRRLRADDRALARMEARWAYGERIAGYLIGELIRDGKKVYYINLRSRNGIPTGKTKEGDYYALVNYLLRNKYDRYL